MKLRKHFRTSESNIDLLVADFTNNRIVNKDVFFSYCVNERLNKLSKQYDDKFDKISSFVIRNYNHTDLPMNIMTKMIMSITKITNALNKGLISLLGR